MRTTTLGTIAMLLSIGASACTHQRTVTPAYAPQVAAGIRPGSICPAGQVIAVSAVNQSPEGNSAGTTHAGVHTFEYRFGADPAQALKGGLEKVLQAGGCRLGSPSAATLAVGILRLEARGLECGFLSCDGSGQSMVQVTLSDAAGRPLVQRMITSTATKGCGMAICNEEEASAIASDVLTDTIKKTVAVFGTEIARQLALSGPATATTPTVPRS